jgi:putative endonuclease
MREEASAGHWIVYMLECADGSLYTGITNNLDRRMAEHAAGKGARYTKGRGPFRLVYSETCEGRAEASRRETAIKLLDRVQKLQLYS